MWIVINVWILVTFHHGEPTVERKFGSFWACRSVSREYKTDPHTVPQCVKSMQDIFVPTNGDKRNDKSVNKKGGIK